jgi:hypothetical protein
VISFLQVSPPKPCIGLSFHPYGLHVPPISLFSILSPAQYWVRSGRRLPYNKITSIHSSASVDLFNNIIHLINTLTPELNPSAQHCLPRLFTGILIFKGFTARRLYKSFDVKGLMRGTWTVQNQSGCQYKFRLLYRRRNTQPCTVKKNSLFTNEMDRRTPKEHCYNKPVLFISLHSRRNEKCSSCLFLYHLHDALGSVRNPVFFFYRSVVLSVHHRWLHNGRNNLRHTQSLS